MLNPLLHFGDGAGRIDDADASGVSLRLGQETLADALVVRLVAALDAVGRPFPPGLRRGA